MVAYSPSKLIEVKNTPNETSETIATQIVETLVKVGSFEICVAFTGDNCNTNFRGVSHKKRNNVFSELKEDKHDLVGVGCSSHITNNCIHYGTNQLTIDVEGIIFKVYQYFNIYAVRASELNNL